MSVKHEKKLKVLVTGNLGYIGSELSKLIKGQNFEFRGIDKDRQKGPDVFSFNLRDVKKTSNVIKSFKPDVLIHTGSHSALIYKNNITEPFLEDFESLQNVLSSLSALPNCRLIYFSSSYVYSGLPSVKKVNEQSALSPKHNFGVAKSFFEQYILRNHPHSVIFRLCSVFGPGRAKHPNTILAFAKEYQQSGQISAWGKGARKLQYVFMEDVLKAAFKGFGLKPGIYNLGGNDYITVAEAVKKIANYFNIQPKFLRDKPEGETLPFLDNKKIKQVLGENFFTPFSPALNKYLNTIE